MHGPLSTIPVLAIAPESLSSLGHLDSNSISDLWGVFTKCKDSIHNGRRLENLSWRLWFDSERRELRQRDSCITVAELSDPEWTETESDSDSGYSPTLHRLPDRPAHGGTISGDSLQRIISHISSIDQLTPLEFKTSNSLGHVKSTRAVTEYSQHSPKTTTSLANLPALTSNLKQLRDEIPSSVTPRATSHLTQPPKKQKNTKQYKSTNKPLGRAATAIGLSNIARSSSNNSLAKSFVKGFDTTTALEHGPQRGTIAPPPTPAVGQTLSLHGTKQPPRACPDRSKPLQKKIFFISSPNSGSDSDASPPDGNSNVTSTANASASVPEVAARPKSRISSTLAKGVVYQEDEDDDDWDSEDDGNSSGWGSEYSSADDATSATKDIQIKTPPPASSTLTGGPGELKPRGPGLLSQLFHPDLIQEGRNLSLPQVTLQGGRSRAGGLHGSKSDMVLTKQNKSFLGGRPADVEMESSSSSDEDEEQKMEGRAYPIRKRSTPSPILAPPQSPRTTRRQMLATELSESLRHNLIWERKTRNRVIVRPPEIQAPEKSDRTGQFMLARENKNKSFEGLRAPHPSPATRNSSPILPGVISGMARKQLSSIHLPVYSKDTDSESEDDDDDDDKEHRKRMYTAGGVHDHGW